jgi:hypothetical protein
MTQQIYQFLMADLEENTCEAGCDKYFNFPKFNHHFSMVETTPSAIIQDDDFDINRLMVDLLERESGGNAKKLIELYAKN